MKNEKGITLMSLLTYIGIMLAVIVIIGRINNTYRAGLDEISDSNTAASDYSKLNQCLLSTTKERTAVIATLGTMKQSSTEADKMEYQKENNPPSTGYSAIQFSCGDTIGLVENRIYYNNTKICDNVEKFIIEKDGETGIKVQVKFKGQEQMSQKYTYR